MKKSLKNMISVRCIPVLLMAVACAPEYVSTRSNSSESEQVDNKSSDLLLTLPISSVEPFNPGVSTFTTSNQNTVPVDANTWLGLDEAQVFSKRLVHTQSGNNWTMKVGKGGQIYSISTPETGEMVAIQRKTHGQWVDEVFQHVIPSYLYQKDVSSTIVDADIHQAGFYTKSDLDAKLQIIPKSIYSPVFPPTHLEFIQAQNSFALTTWPQHAHLPRTYSENGVLMHQMMRDLGDGVIEVTLLINKWQGVETRDINLPWSAWRPQNLPSVLLSNPDGSYTENNQPFAQTRELLSEGQGQRKLLKAGTPNWSPDTGGWIAVAKSSSSDSKGIGIVFGKNASAIEGDASYLRWGNYSVGKPEEGTVITVKRNIRLLPGDSVYARYFMVIGSVSKIQHYGNLLQSRVEIGRINNDEMQSGLICISQDPVQKFKRGCAEGSSALFHTYRDFQANAKPLFILGRKDGSYVLTSNPYEISSDPTDGATVSYSFLGWALPSGQVPTFRYLKLSDMPAVSGVTISSQTLPLYVRTANLTDPTKLSSDASIKSIASSSGQSIDLSASPISVQLKAAPLTVTITVAERAKLTLLNGTSILRESTGPTLTFTSNEWPGTANYSIAVTAEDGTKASYALKMLEASADTSLKAISSSSGQVINAGTSPIDIKLGAAPLRVTIRGFERATVTLVKGATTLRSSTGTLTFTTNEWPNITSYWINVTAENGAKASYILRFLPR